MKIRFVKTNTDKKGTLIFLCIKSSPLEGYLKELDIKGNKSISKAIKVAGFSYDFGETLEILCPQNTKLDRIIIVGLGEKKKINRSSFEEIGSLLTTFLNSKKIKESSICLDSYKDILNKYPESPANLIFGLYLNSYRFNKYFSDANKKRTMCIKSITMLYDKVTLIKKKWQELEQVAQGVFLTRNLVSEPANVMNPKQLALEASKLKKYGVKIEILDEKKMKVMKMGALLGVSQGSINKPFMVLMSWKGKNSSKDYEVSLVGKGVTFDTGGISIKPSNGMEDMKWDMGGAASVIGAMRAIAGRKAKVNVSAVIGLVENMPSGSAQRPGDVVTSMAGKTIEVINTDAEGRLVLADAVWTAQEKFNPKNIIDLATLTGAVIVSLGSERAGLFCNDDSLSKAIENSGNSVNEKFWRLPIDDTYDKDISSDIADMKNVGSGRGAGSTAGAMFIKRFIKDIPWAHLDIAGVTWSKKDKPMVPKGGTGFGVRALDNLVRDYWEK